MLTVDHVDMKKKKKSSWAILPRRKGKGSDIGRQEIVHNFEEGTPRGERASFEKTDKGDARSSKFFGHDLALI